MRIARWPSHLTTPRSPAQIRPPHQRTQLCRLAWALDATHGYGAALQVLESLPAAARRTLEARVLAGNLHYYEGYFALALTAYGDPYDLDRYDRKSRRRCVRRALWRHRRAASQGDIGAVNPASFDPVPPGLAQVLDRAALLIDESARMRELAKAAIEEHGRHPQLLLALADAERLSGDRHASAALAIEALRAAPEDPLIAAEGIRMLWLADYDADALRAIADLSDQLKSTPAVRQTAGEIYEYWQLREHAVEAFGKSGLAARYWGMRRACWWRSGGPVGRIHSASWAREDSLLSDSALPEQWVAALSALPLSAGAIDVVRSDLATYHLIRTHGTVFRPGVLNDWLNRTFVPVSTIIVFAALALSERLHWPSAGFTRGLTAAAFATVAEAAALWILGEITWRWATRIGVAAACGIGGSFLLRSNEQWAYGAGLALTALGAVIVGGYLLGQTIRFASRIRVARWQRDQAETGVLSALLDLLGELSVPQQRRDASLRRECMNDLERVAVSAERDLPHALRSGDPASQNAIAAHARSAATALRGMKRAVALPSGTSWQDLTERLSGLASALASQDFGNWPPPLPEMPPQPPRPLWRQVMHAGRTVLAILVLPLGVYLLPLVLPLSGPGLSWLRLAAIVWALLGTVIAVDPAWNERITKMRQGLDLLRSAAPPKGTDGSPAPYGPADAPPPQAPDTPRRTPARRPPRTHTTRTRR